MEDLAELERIIVLRYLGLSLHQIANLLPNLGDQPTLADTLAAQTNVLRERPPA